VWDKEMFDLPELPAFPVTLHAQSNSMSDGVERLRAIIRNAVADTLRANKKKGQRGRLAPAKFPTAA
jgi:hypothetical protein